MIKTNLTLVVFGLLCANLLAQQNLPVINALSSSVDIREDGILKINAWSLAPEVNPDVYTTSAKKVTFFTDIDSISITTEKNKTYDFVIILNQKDSARTRIVWQPSKLDILKKGSDYDYTDNRFVPKFTYQSKDDPDLVKIRKTLQLDSIAGDGNELSQIFNLLDWTDNVIEHDGNSSNPALKNAVDLLKVCKADKRGLNCRMLATFLNDCYLAMGIKSRIVTCMPKETEFDDCHVINMVFSKELNKWIWMDPTFGAYLMDTNGNLLGIEEVRKRLINEETVLMNPDANWNRTYLQTKEHYLGYYMPKNLYRLESPLVSEYNAETKEPGKEIIYVELLPLDGIEQSPQKNTVTYKESNVTFINYKTNNPNVFWATPE